MADLLSNLLPNQVGASTELVVVSTRGDRDTASTIHSLGGTGVFVKEVQDAVLRGDADLAVHSAKDLPAETPDGLVLRHVYARVPARVEYELSDTGEALLAALAPLLDWGKLHQEEIAEARERFDRLQLWRAAGQEMQQTNSVRQPRVPGVY